MSLCGNDERRRERRIHRSTGDIADLTSILPEPLHYNVPPFRKQQLMKEDDKKRLSAVERDRIPLP